MIAGVIFDIDGTLLDSLSIWGDVGVRYLQLYGIQAEEGLSDLLWPMAMEESSAYLKAHYPLEASEAEIREGILKLIEDFYVQEVPLKEGVREVLEALWEKEIPMALATTGDAKLAEAALRRLGVFKYFRVLYAASDLHTTKKEPLIFEKAAEVLGTKKEETYVAEDTCYALLTAKNAGFRTIAVYDPVSEPNWVRMQEEADLSVRKLNELFLHPLWDEENTGEKR